MLVVLINFISYVTMGGTLLQLVILINFIIFYVEEEEEEEKEEKPSPVKKVRVESPPAGDSRAAGETGGSGRAVEIVFSFDTTGSMYPCLTQVECRVE